LSEGNIFAGEFLAPQMFFFRPAPGWSQYRTPIDGYYQCGSGTHPGGCVIGRAGKLAAGQILKDLRRTDPPGLSDLPSGASIGYPKPSSKEIAMTREGSRQPQALGNARIGRRLVAAFPGGLA
jgi:hypothetical protein